MDDILDILAPEARARVLTERQQAAPPAYAGTFHEAIPEARRAELFTPDEIASARQRIQGPSEGTEAPGRFIARHSIPGYSAARNFIEANTYSESKKRITDGRGRQSDYDFVHEYEAEQRRDTDRGVGGHALVALASAPAIIGEYAAGGAVLGNLARAGQGAGLATRIGSHALRATAITPFIPSSYLPQMAQDNIAAGRPVTSLAGLPAAVAVGAINNAILGTLQPLGNLVPGASAARFLARNMVRGGAGVVEQSIADLATGAMHLSTGYGTVGDLLAGRGGDALKHATVQFITFTAFGMMHDVQHGAPTAQEFAERLREAAKEGLPSEQAAEAAIRPAAEWMHEQLAAQGPRPGEEAMPETRTPVPNETNLPPEAQKTAAQVGAATEPPRIASEPPAPATVRMPTEAAPAAPAATPALPAPVPVRAAEQRTKTELTPREKSVVDSYGQTRSLRMTAKELGVSHETVRSELAKAQEKMVADTIDPYVIKTSIDRLVSQGRSKESATAQVLAEAQRIQAQETPKSTAEREFAQQRAFQLQKMATSRTLTEKGDLAHDPADVAEATRQIIEAHAAEKQYEKSVDAILKELEHGEPTPEQRRSIFERIEAERARLEARNNPPSAEARSRTQTASEPPIKASEPQAVENHPTSQPPENLRPGSESATGGESGAGRPVAAPSVEQRTPPPSPWGGEQAVGVKKEALKDQREARGEAELPGKQWEPAPQIHDKARAELMNDPEIGQRLIDEYAARPRPFETTRDVAMAVLEVRRLHNEIRKSTTAVSEQKLKGNEKESEAASNRLNTLLERMELTEAVARSSGSRSGEVFNSLKMMAKENFDLTFMLAKMRAAKKGSISAEEQQKIAAQHAEIQKLQEKVDALETQLAKDGLGAGSPVHGPWEAAILETKIKQHEFLADVAQAKYKAMTPGQRAIENARLLRIEALISSPITAGKVGMSSIFQPLAHSAREALGSVLKMLPGIGQVAKAAPIEGRGFHGETEAIAAKAVVTTGLKAAKDTMVRGYSDIDAVHGGMVQPRSWLRLFGLFHAAEKAPAVQAAYERAWRNVLASEKANGNDYTSPTAIQSAKQQAYQEGIREKFQQDNAVVDAWRKAINSLKNPNNSGGAQALGHAMDVMVPIVRTPTNIVADTFSYAFGLPVGLARTGAAKMKGWENLTQPQAESIMRQLKKGTLGMPLLMLGYFAASGLGGFYSGRRREDEAKAGEISTPFGMVPAWATAHHPAFMALQLGASIRRTEEDVKKNGRQGLGTGIVKGLGGLLEEIPFVREQTEMGRAFEGGFNENAVGRIAASFAVPALIQFIATQTDNADLRKPEGFLQQIEARTPGLRQLTPERVRSVEDVHTELNRVQQARQAHMSNPETSRTPFGQERDFVVLNRFNHEIMRLEHIMRGDARAGRGPYRAGEGPPPETVKLIRDRQRELATRALEMVR